MDWFLSLGSGKNFVALLWIASRACLKVYVQDKNYMQECDPVTLTLHLILLFWFFTSHQQSFSNVGTGFLGLNQY